MTNELAVRPSGNELALDNESGFWNEKQIAALRQLGVESATNGDLAVFHHVCQRTGLDPFARQIYMIRRDGKQTIQTGIDGFRLVARRAVDAAAETLSISAPEWCGADGVWTDVWLKDGPPAAARVTVLRNGQSFPAIALYREYVQTYIPKGGGEETVTKMWRVRPAGQLAKCAEALALRKAFPQDLSGIYSDDEMDSASSARPAAPHRRARVRDEDIVGTGDVIEGEVVEDGPEHAEQAQPPLDLRSKLAKEMFARLGEAGITNDNEQRDFISASVGRSIASRKDLTESDARRVIDSCTNLMAMPEADEADEYDPTLDPDFGKGSRTQRLAEQDIEDTPLPGGDES